ncbi:hypothetical protein M441DRAFT_108725, partial [Trichoderma asperellum CBS 433.97]
SKNAQNDNTRVRNTGNFWPSNRRQGQSIFRTPRKQRSQVVTEAEEARLESQQADIKPSLIGSTCRTATVPITAHENATSTPHRYGLRARRASRGSFPTPSRCGRTASRQKLQQQLQQRNNVNDGGAAAIRIGFQLDFGI